MYACFIFVVQRDARGLLRPAAATHFRDIEFAWYMPAEVVVQRAVLVAHQHLRSLFL
jgi:hypothetical protein